MAIRISPKDRISMIALAEGRYYSSVDLTCKRIDQLKEAGYLTNVGGVLLVTENGLAVIQDELDERARLRATEKIVKELHDAAIEQRKTEVADLLTAAGCTQVDYVNWNPHKKCIEVYFELLLCLYPSDNGRYAIYAYDKHDKKPLIAADIVEETRQAETARYMLNVRQGRGVGKAGGCQTGEGE